MKNIKLYQSLKRGILSKSKRNFYYYTTIIWIEQVPWKTALYELRLHLKTLNQLHYARSIKPHNIETMDCRLWTVDKRFKVHASVKKNSSAHISIFQRILKFPVAKRERSNSSSLNLALPCCACQTWPLQIWGRGCRKQKDLRSKNI